MWEDAALLSSRPRASPAGILPKPHGWPQFTCPCALFSPARVDRRHPRLRHKAHSRGAASAASRPPQARARAVIKVHLSAQRSADRSVRRLRRLAPPDCSRLTLNCQAAFRPPGGSATRSNGRCALPHRSAPHRGIAVGTGAAALCPCCCFLSPLHPPKGTLRIA